MFLIILLLSIAGLLYFYLTKNYDYWKKRNVLGPEPKLLVGNFPSIYNTKLLLLDEIKEIYAKYKGKTPVVGIFRGAAPAILVLDHNVVKQVLVTNFSHFVNQHMFAAVSCTTKTMCYKKLIEIFTDYERM